MGVCRCSIQGQNVLSCWKVAEHDGACIVLVKGLPCKIIGELINETEKDF